MEFRTEFSAKPSSLTIELEDRILTMGSCFAQSIGKKLFDHKFQTEINPFGTTYHPVSIHKQLAYALLNELPPDHSYTSHNGIESNFDFHSSFSGISKKALESGIQEKIELTGSFLRKCKVLVLTYGTSWIYERKDNGETVANCHKVPSTSFTKRLSGENEIVESFRKISALIRSVNPGLKFILTVSPVRHIRDTLELNCISKSILRSACYRISQSNEQVCYFPAFEIMMDDLRDYRYYKDDLIHPTEMAEEYIWQKFSSMFFGKTTIDFIRQWDEIRKNLAHRAFQLDSTEHRLFLQGTLERLQKLGLLVNVDREIEQVKEQLNTLVK